MNSMIQGYTIETIGATPMKCLDLDDTNGQQKLEGWLYIL